MAGYPEIPLVQARGGSIGNVSEVSISQLIDAALCSDPGAILIRDVDYWKCLEPSTPGYVLTTQGVGAPPAWTPGGTVVSVSFTSFTITGQSTPVEVGTALSGTTRTFTWTTSNNALVAANSISIADTTGSVTLGSGLANNGSHIFSFSDITNNVPASNVWTITGTNTGGGTFSRTYTVSWLWRVYAGTSASATLNANAIKALASASLQSTFVGSYPLAAGDYKYFSYPDSMGDVIAFRDPNTGFLFSMATASDNAAYSNVQSNGWAYALVSVTNAQSVATNYRVFRSQYILGGAITMAVT